MDFDNFETINHVPESYVANVIVMCVRITAPFAGPVHDTVIFDPALLLLKTVTILPIYTGPGIGEDADGNIKVGVVSPCVFHITNPSPSCTVYTITDGSTIVTPTCNPPENATVPALLIAS